MLSAQKVAPLSRSHAAQGQLGPVSWFGSCTYPLSAAAQRGNLRRVIRVNRDSNSRFLMTEFSHAAMLIKAEVKGPLIQGLSPMRNRASAVAAKLSQRRRLRSK